MTATRDASDLTPEILDTLVAIRRQFLAFLERRTGSRADAERRIDSTA